MLRETTHPFVPNPPFVFFALLFSGAVSAQNPSDSDDQNAGVEQLSAVLQAAHQCSEELRNRLMASQQLEGAELAAELARQRPTVCAEEEAALTALVPPQLLTNELLNQ